MNSGLRILASVALASAVASVSYAQETSSNKVAEKTDWAVFVENDPKECWAVSVPKETVNTRQGRVVSVRRGEILFFVTYNPASGVNGQVSFTGGYPFTDKEPVDLNIDGKSYSLFAQGEWAWAAKGQDSEIIAAMKRGAKAIVTAKSARGTTTKDTFSLSGVTAAIEDAEKRCK